LGAVHREQRLASVGPDPEASGKGLIEAWLSLERRPAASRSMGGQNH
jgi:hypothetical protein